MAQNRDWIRGKGDGHFDGVHALRDAANADVVVFITGAGELAGFAGFASNRANAFCAVRADQAYRNFSMVHEIGHLIGMKHSHGNIQPPSDWASVEIHVVNASCPGGFCARDGYWTDPGRKHPQHGFPLGATAGQNGVRVHNNGGAARVANF